MHLVCSIIYIYISVWHIPMLCVQWKTRDDGQRNCPKHVEFYSKNKFEKLVHLVWFYDKNLSRCTVTWTSKEKFCLLHLLRIRLKFLLSISNVSLYRPDNLYINYRCCWAILYRVDRGVRSVCSCKLVI